MDIQKIFAELGRMYLEVLQLKEKLAQAEAQIQKLQNPPASAGE